MAFHGKHKPGQMRDEKQRKYEEALARNKETPHTRTRAHRLGKCECSDK